MAYIDKDKLIKEMSTRKLWKAHIRRVCRKCGARLVNKPEYGVVCPKCGWTFVSWTDYEPDRKEVEDE